MTHTYSTYHSRRQMDRDNLYQLSYYGEVKRTCSLLDAPDHAADVGTGELFVGEDDDGDGYNRGAGGGSVPHRSSPGRSNQRESERLAASERLVKSRGGAHWEVVRSSSFAYLLHHERVDGAPRWRLRLVQGLPGFTYEEYKATPLHFACAGRHREEIILLLQNGSKDCVANFYLHTPMLCSSMLEGDARLQELFAFWQRPPALSAWAPAHHKCFPAAFQTAVRAVVAALGRVRNRPSEHTLLCNDLLLAVIGWVPSDVATLVRWWPKHRATGSAAAGARKRQRSPPAA
eukprot:TRINITY_DN11598_c0_g1_i1.p2 TRINITY_DN11598_c0_g1~~TRINITY_DN11598_c0_g1_i1.p2  ORF type:complete len:289 (+),score=60.36 TRINITY_DN11598_c0_g1_i1:390-1256(+)